MLTTVPINSVLFICSSVPLVHSASITRRTAFGKMGKSFVTYQEASITAGSPESTGKIDYSRCTWQDWMPSRCRFTSCLTPCRLWFVQEQLAPLWCIENEIAFDQQAVQCAYSNYSVICPVVSSRLFGEGLIAVYTTCWRQSVLLLKCRRDNNHTFFILKVHSLELPWRNPRSVQL